ncbi:hypothetical protein BT69DRAFT_1234412 [Atractiella rhizophila]|nr:hypothetical protein BT69DRAFT_1234412 [Atractiella rhizophila]
MHEWWDVYDWLLIPSLLLLGFPLDILHVLDSFVCGCRLAWQHEISKQERLRIRELFASFVTNWEKVYVHGDHTWLSRMPMCIHHLLHIANWILWWGPGILYSQFPMEGMIGFLKKRINQDNRYQENLLNQALL